jgi:hypothetical protein
MYVLMSWPLDSTPDDDDMMRAPYATCSVEDLRRRSF